MTRKCINQRLQTKHMTPRGRDTQTAVQNKSKVPSVFFLSNMMAELERAIKAAPHNMDQQDSVRFRTDSLRHRMHFTVDPDHLCNAFIFQRKLSNQINILI